MQFIDRSITSLRSMNSDCDREADTFFVAYIEDVITHMNCYNTDQWQWMNQNTCEC